jgi:hypothetical protein
VGSVEPVRIVVVLVVAVGEVVAVVELVGRGEVTVVVGKGIVGSGTVGSVIVRKVIVVVGSCVAAAGGGSSPKVSHKPVATAAKDKRPTTRRASTGVRVRSHPWIIGTTAENLRPPDQRFTLKSRLVSTAAEVSSCG